jgi:hypothetical protein
MELADRLKAFQRTYRYREIALAGVRHFIGLAPPTILRWLLQASPAPVVRWFMWRTWQVLLADLGPDRRFWTELLSTILKTDLSKASLIAMMAAIADFTAHYRPTADRSGRPVLVLQSEQDRAFLGQPGRTLLRPNHRQTHPPRRAHQRPSPRSRHPRLDRHLERESQTIRLDQDRRRDPQLPHKMSGANFRRRTLVSYPVGASQRAGCGQGPH